MVTIDNNKVTKAFGGDPSVDTPDQNVTGLGSSSENAYITQLNSVVDLTEDSLVQPRQELVQSQQGGETNVKNNNIKPRNIPMAAVRSGGAYINKAYGGGYIRKAAEGNIAMPPMGGMLPPPPSEDIVGSVSPDMAKEAESLGITVAPPGATAEEVADDQLVLLSEGELVVPANVVRYHGLSQYEKMRKSALDGLNVMDQEGQLVSPQEEAPEGLLGPTMPEGAPV